MNPLALSSQFPEELGQLFARISKDGRRAQTLREHLANVAALSCAFAGKAGMGPVGYATGALHDAGKGCREFQSYLMGTPVPALSKQHSWAGAAIAQALFSPDGSPSPLAACIMGHHSGLDNFANLQLEDHVPSGLSDYGFIKTAFDGFQSPKMTCQDAHHMTRMLYSCLCDADSLDAEAFETPNQSDMRMQCDALPTLLRRLEQHLERLEQQAPNTPFNRARRQLQEQCALMASRPRGTFSLEAPTGLGKTLGAIRWALRHAIENGLERIIIAEPFVSVISQAAAQLRDIFGDGNVLEHHSQLFRDCGDEAADSRHFLAEENWDLPIVVTSNARLLESMHSCRRSKCRRLHNVANSVIILDEPQELPARLLQPIVYALDCYRRLFRCSLLLCSASLPPLKGTLEGLSGATLKGFDNIEPILPVSLLGKDSCKRARIEEHKKPLTHLEAARIIGQHRSVLCIVNRREDARLIGQLLRQNGIGCLHLSRSMCPEHCDKVIAEIKRRIKAGENVRAVSTSMIETGVDLDFEFVMRQEAGLPSILQAAGRCNREGLRDCGTVMVFKLQDSPVPKGEQAKANSARLDMPPDMDPFSQEALTEFFRCYYGRCDSFDRLSNGLSASCCANAMMYRTIDDNFRIVPEEGKLRVLVTYDQESESIAKRIEQGENARVLWRQANRHCVSLPSFAVAELQRRGAVRRLAPSGLLCLTDPMCYDSIFGFNPQPDSTKICQNQMQMPCC